MTVLDQAVSSGTNVLTSVIAAHLLGVGVFGAVVLALSLGTLAIAAQRAAVGDTVLSRGPAGRDSNDISDALATAVALGLIAAVVGGLAGLLPLQMTEQVPWMAIWLPAVLAQDAYRYVFFAAGRPVHALITDVVWAVVQIGGLAVVIAAGRSGPVAFFAAWGCGALVSVAVAAGLSGVVPFRGRPLRWLRKTRHLSGWFAGQTLVAQGHAQLILFTLAGILSTAAIGGLRAIQLVLILPVQTFLLAAQSTLVPSLATAHAAGRYSDIRSTVRRLTVQFALAAVAVSGLAVFFRRQLIETLFTESFLPYTGLMLPLALTTTLTAARMPYTAACRGLGDARATFLLQSIFTAGTVPAVCLGGAVWGLTGAGWGFAAGASVALAASVRSYRAALTRAEDGSVPHGARYRGRHRAAPRSRRTPTSRSSHAHRTLTAR